jgi:hypothetical protein
MEKNENAPMLGADYKQQEETCDDPSDPHIAGIGASYSVLQPRHTYDGSFWLTRQGLSATAFRTRTLTGMATRKAGSAASTPAPTATPTAAQQVPSATSA